jgi:hypothetical protein
MALHPTSQRFVDEFFAAIAPYEGAYQSIGFSYFAVKIGDRFVIKQGLLFLNTRTPPNAASKHFRSPRIHAGHYPLADLKIDLRGFIDRLLQGQLDTPDGMLHFPAAEGGHHAAAFMPLHPDGLQRQTRFTYLMLMGGQIEPLRQPETDWDIKAGSPPYDGAQELVNEFGLGSLTSDTLTVGIVAYNVAVIDAQNSKVDGTNAEVRVVLAKELANDRVSVGFRTYAPGVPAVRGIVPGTALQWTDQANPKHGQTTIQVPNAAVLNCTVSYDGIAQAHLWLSDPAKVQNPRRAIYETFDPKLQNLQAIISGGQNRGQDARLLESAVAWLLWMFGFSAAHLGAMPRVQDAADLLVSSPAGHFAVVECTTGLLKAENKLALLHSRAAAVRRSLDATNNTATRVLPTIVTSRARTDVEPDIEAAEKLGIYVMTRENLDDGITQTMFQPNADQMYAGAEQIVAANLEKHRSQGTLSLGDNAG